MDTLYATAPVDCPEGTYSLGDGTSDSEQYTCTVCPAGYECPNPGEAPTECASDTEYSVAGSTACASCLAGRECSLDVSGSPGYPPACAPGETWSAGECAPCAAGSFCESPTASAQSAPTDPNGLNYYCEAGSFFPTLCPAGSSCTTETATACSDDEFSMAGQSECYGADEISESGVIIDDSAQYPMICQDGYMPDSNECVQCVFGEICLNGLVTDSCSDDELCFRGASEKLVCPDYMDCSSETTAYDGISGDDPICPGGTYLDGGSCENCDAGYYCDFNSKTPVDTGYYSPDG